MSNMNVGGIDYLGMGGVGKKCGVVLTKAPYMQVLNSQTIKKYNKLDAPSFTRWELVLVIALRHFGLVAFLYRALVFLDWVSLVSHLLSWSQSPISSPVCAIERVSLAGKGLIYLQKEQHKIPACHICFISSNLS